MRSFLDLWRSLGSAGARDNARAELELAEARRLQAATVVCRVEVIDGATTGPDRVVPGRPVAVPTAA